MTLAQAKAWQRFFTARYGSASQVRIAYLNYRWALVTTHGVNGVYAEIIPTVENAILRIGGTVYPKGN